MMCSKRLVPTLACLTVLPLSAMAAEGVQSTSGSALTPAPGPGKTMAWGGSGGLELDHLQGSLLIESIRQKDYNQGAAETNTSQMWMRAELGTSVEVGDDMEVRITLAYDAEGGDQSHVAGASNDRSGEIVLDDAYVVFERFFLPNADLWLGRQPVAWNLRTKPDGGFLWDSRANDPTVTSWDGARFYYNMDQLTFIGQFFIINESYEGRGAVVPPVNTGDESDDQSLYGLVIDWQPENESDNRVFFTVSWTHEEDVPMSVGTAGTAVASEIDTFYVGTEWNLTSGFDLYGEYARQDGSIDGGGDTSGSGYSGGIVWHAKTEDLRKAAFNIQYDSISGDSNGTTDNEYEALIDPFEGRRDLYIAEHERYGELAERVGDGGLDAWKIGAEYVFQTRQPVSLRLDVGRFTLNDAPAGVDDEFGVEYDFTMRYEYNSHTAFTMFYALFEVGNGYADLLAENEDVQLVGFSALMEY